mmetsp:Transcript_25948/g.57283  ORF Transcript_25948/g.57283 Transcript_25948/m.57283 type:complete len:216 (-) Transcript_25948:279-926(-)|eukprot:CAMPEP_0204252360 /NCGR_PEP_ID=MMETSP0468-20130131/1137_1 /ASSEMBLY_ACC=CAM_ASM_000383 /TAXON_ID=2969 /ORGANISM="Oxyrrhis marina" /LENGTH=215 /DNA_ID=CAMNT_0051225781 /DNA_START=60 /DNA_END=707 /DNA_ORIENTATION=+
MRVIAAFAGYSALALECKITSGSSGDVITTTPDETCCAYQTHALFSIVARNLPAGMTWSMVGGMVGITACTVPTEMGSCDDDPANVADEGTTGFMSAYICDNWETCNTNGMQSTGMAAQIGGSFADDAGKASFCAAKDAYAAEAAAHTTGAPGATTATTAAATTAAATTAAATTAAATTAAATETTAAGGSSELSGAGGLGVAVAFAALAARVVV